MTQLLASIQGYPSFLFFFFLRISTRVQTIQGYPPLPQGVGPCIHGYIYLRFCNTRAQPAHANNLLFADLHSSTNTITLPYSYSVPTTVMDYYRLQVQFRVDNCKRAAMSAIIYHYNEYKRHPDYIRSPARLTPSEGGDFLNRKFGCDTFPFQECPQNIPNGAETIPNHDHGIRSFFSRSHQQHMIHTLKP